MTNPRLAIYYLSFGSGHLIAAQAIAKSIRANYPEISVEVEDPFSSAIKFLPSVLGGMQAAAIKLAPEIFDFAWRSCSMEMNGFGFFQEFLLQKLNRQRPNIIIATHVVPCILASRLKVAGKLNNNVKVFAVVTDFALNPIWPHAGVDGYFVTHEELRRTLIFRGASPDIIHVTGIPINPDFDSCSKMEQSDGLRILLMAGGIGNGGYVLFNRYLSELLDSLSNLDTSRLELCVVTGTQTQLKKNLESRVVGRSPYRLEVKGYVEQMESLIATCDIIMTKPGGLITAEALALGKPLILCQPAPGIEAANLEFLVRQGVALPGRSIEEARKSLEICLLDPKLVKKMKLLASRLGFPNSAHAIVDHILEWQQPASLNQAMEDNFES